MRSKAVKELAGLITNKTTSGQLDVLKKKVSEKHGLGEVVKNSEVLEALKGRHNALLRIREGRSLSGVAVIAVMPKPAPCPGKCTYCPTSEIAPKSYTGFEPSARRSRQNEFDAFKTVANRIAQLEAIGHKPRKCELIIMGGTFNALPLEYQENFVKKAFDAFNESSSKTLEEAKKLNEKAKYRVVGVTFETRPDFCSEKQVSQLVDFGATRVEIGVQSLEDGVLRRVKRGHTVAEAKKANRTLRDSLLKVGMHLMPGLYLTPEKDVAMFEKLFDDAMLKPDMLKIYPCLVMPGTELFEEWKKGEFKPYDAEQAAEVIAEGKKYIPKYCRVMRVDRDIPTNLIAGGVMKSNLRQLVQEKMREKGISCQCIRCREAGLAGRTKKVRPENAELQRIDYDCCNGKEVFLSFEDVEENVLFGFLRLRKPFKTFRPELKGNNAGVRELHVYGEQLQLHERKAKCAQHRGFGKKLLEKAEEIAREEWKAEKLFVISGVGAREYYYKNGFVEDGAYVSKDV